MSTYTLVNTKTAPAVSILLPIEKTHATIKLEEGKLKDLVKRAEKELLDDYPLKTAEVIIDKMHKVVEKINLRDYAGGMAIYVSELESSVLGFPFPVKEKLVVDKSFEVRDLIYLARFNWNYILLSISQKHARIFYGYDNYLTELKNAALPANAEEVEIDHPSKVGNFTTVSELNEINFEKYLRAIDASLTEELKTLDAPVILLGVEKTIGLFRKVSHNNKRIFSSVCGNFDHLSLSEISKAVQPEINLIRKDEQTKQFAKLEKAISSKKYVSGIENVWMAAKEKRGQLLLVEKDFYCSAKIENNRLIVMEKSADDLSMITKDAVDDIVEMVVKSEGEVVFVDNHSLPDHGRIALITYF